MFGVRPFHPSPTFSRHRHFKGTGAVVRQRALVDLGTAVERLADTAHLARHALIADAHLAQIVIHVAAERIEYALRQSPGGCPACAQPPQEQRQMQHDQVEPTQHSIWRAI